MKNLVLERIEERSLHMATADEELELVQCAQKGDALAFAELMGKYRSRIITSICHTVQDGEEAAKHVGWGVEDELNDRWHGADFDEGLE